MGVGVVWGVLPLTHNRYAVLLFNYINTVTSTQRNQQAIVTGKRSSKQNAATNNNNGSMDVVNTNNKKC